MLTVFQRGHKISIDKVALPDISVNVGRLLTRTSSVSEVNTSPEAAIVLAGPHQSPGYDYMVAVSATYHEGCGE